MMAADQLILVTEEKIIRNKSTTTMKLLRFTCVVVVVAVFFIEAYGFETLSAQYADLSGLEVLGFYLLISFQFCWYHF